MRPTIFFLPLLLCLTGCKPPTVTIEHIEIAGPLSAPAEVTINGKADEDPAAESFAVGFTLGEDGLAADPGPETAWDLDFEVLAIGASGGSTEILTISVDAWRKGEGKHKGPR